MTYRIVIWIFQRGELPRNAKPETMLKYEHKNILVEDLYEKITNKNNLYIIKFFILYKRILRLISNMFHY